MDNKYTIISLPLLLLRKITNYLDNIDRICFSLVCKRIYFEKNKYLCLNLCSIKDSGSLNIGFKSYIDVLEKSINSSNSLSIECDTINSFIEYVDKVSDETKSCITEIVFKSLKFKNLDRVVFYNYLLFLPNLQSLKINSDETILIVQPNYFPPTIKSLYIYSRVAIELGIGCLPNSLEHLGLYNFRSPLRLDIIGCLPHSLVSLVLENSFPEVLEPGVLPPNIQHLQLYYFEGRITDNTLPKSLRTLKGVPTSWNKQIQTLPNITELSFVYMDRCNDKHFNISKDIPSTVTYLELESFGDMLCGKLPSNITTIKFMDYTYPNYEYVAFSEETEFKYVEFENISIKNFLKFPLKVKHVSIGDTDDDISSILSMIPDTVETLGLKTTYQNGVNVIIPASVTTLDLRGLGVYCLNSDFTIPVGIRTLLIDINYIFHFSKASPKHVIPSTIISFLIYDRKDIPNLLYQLRRIDQNHIIVLSQEYNLQGGFYSFTSFSEFCKDFIKRDKNLKDLQNRSMEYASY